MSKSPTTKSPTTNRWVCIHGHFYQPPRENPWLEAVEVQDSAAPFHDWNERITAECYAPNARARFLDDGGRITNVVNNYERISFNFGPTLLAWLEAKQPRAYAAILEADERSAERFSGHGSAMAQAHGHLIMPLANPRDRRTQVRWGVRDFERRFGRRPEGMWLPETAVNVDTLEALAENEVRFTVLAPYQAARVRKKGSKAWRDVTGGHVDPSRAYRCPLPSGRSIDLFFYDGPISNAVAFENLLERGDRFAGRLMDAFDAGREHTQLVHIATDGETYGHHHRYGDMALAYALLHIEEDPSVRLTNYGEFLEQFPPKWEVEIVEDTAWSCAHGVERWRSDCGCSSSGRPEWSQSWRQPLREALDWLRDEVAPRFERRGGELFKDPWAARDAYIDVISDRSEENVDAWLAEHGTHPLEGPERVEALRLLELQRNAMLMYTSCGWFFAELSGIETVQVIQYASRVVQLAELLFGPGVEAGFLERLERAPSNLPEHGDGRRIYEKFCKPAQIDLERVGAHHALTSLFYPHEDGHDVYCYAVDEVEELRREVGAARLNLGCARVRSGITGDSTRLAYAALHLGGHDLSGGVRAREDVDYDALRDQLLPLFEHAEFSQLVRALDRAFDGEVITLRALFRDEQRRVLQRILSVERKHVEDTYAAIHHRTAPLLRFLSSLEQPAPITFRRAAEIVLNARVRQAVEAEEPDAVTLKALLEEARSMNVELDERALSFQMGRALSCAAEALREAPEDSALLERFAGTVQLAVTLPFRTDPWEAQNVWFELARGSREAVAGRAEADEEARSWLETFEALREPLNIHPEAGPS